MADEPTLDPVHDPLSPTQKPGWKSIEGVTSSLVSLLGMAAVILAALQDQGVSFGNGTVAAIVGGVIAMAASMKLVSARTNLKISANEATAKAAAIIATAGKPDPS
jgi:hypothetical protein